MGTYIILGTFDREGAVQLLKSDIGAELVRTMAEELNGRLVDLWVTTGPYDLVAIVDMQDTRSALAFAVTFGTVARAATTTMAAADSGDVLGPARKSHTRHEGRFSHTRHEARA